MRRSATNHARAVSERQLCLTEISAVRAKGSVVMDRSVRIARAARNRGSPVDGRRETAVGPFNATRSDWRQPRLDLVGLASSEVRAGTGRGIRRFGGLDDVSEARLAGALRTIKPRTWAAARSLPRELSGDDVDVEPPSAH